MGKITISKTSVKEANHEFVERKGVGHPDTLADGLAEKLSVEYSKYTRRKYGAILHHNFDKVGLLGGASYVRFGKGYMTEPIRVLLNGRVSTKFSEDKIPVRRLLARWTKEFFREMLPIIDPENDLDLHYNLSSQSSPGKTYEKESLKGTRRYWFRPRGLYDLRELKRLISNDTSLGVGYAPLSTLEKLALKIEKHLNSKITKRKYPWLGTDIKVMGVREKESYFVTVCVPQIANYVHNLREYKANLKKARSEILNLVKQFGIDSKKFKLGINTRDDFSTRELYLTASGSSLESGDEGLVGRGNRVNGLISPSKPMSMEGVCGKNPVYHIGKVYNVAASEIAREIYEKFGVENQVYLVSQTGRDLRDPWQTVVVIRDSQVKEEILRKFVSKKLIKIPTLTRKITQSKFSLY